jgi:beta-glucanase (GH16 family)
MDYQGGLMSTWNKFCFTGGLVETSVTLPGYNNIVGLWPAVWTMGNLGLYKLTKQLFQTNNHNRTGGIWCKLRGNGMS